MPVHTLATSAELAAVIPLAHLSVVLFTALWSLESSVALSVLERVSASFPPHSEPPHVAFYTVPIAIAEVHRDPPAQHHTSSLRAALAAWRDGEAEEAARFAFNATRGIPWFPSVRVFFSPMRSANNNVSHTTYMDSWTVPAVQGFLVEIAESYFRHLVHLKRESEAGQIGLPSESNCDAGFAKQEGPSSRCPANDLLASILGVSPFPRHVARNENALCNAASEIALSQKALLELFGRQRRPAEISPDRFTELLSPHGGDPGTNPLRAIVVVIPGGAKAVEARHRQQWDILESAARGSVQPDGRAWIETVVDSGRFAEFAHRHGVAPSHEAPAVVLLDYLHDKQLNANAMPDTVDAASELLRSFVEANASTLRPQRSLHADQSFEGSENRAPVPGDSEKVLVVTSDIVEREIEKLAMAFSVWLIVHQPWCGFSQRAMAVLRRFAAEAPPHVRVVELSDVDGMPLVLDSIVDGFPTILRVQAPCDINKKCNFVEYSGVVSVEELLRLSAPPLGV